MNDKQFRIAVFGVRFLSALIVSLFLAVLCLGAVRARADGMDGTNAPPDFVKAGDAAFDVELATRNKAERISARIEENAARLRDETTARTNLVLSTSLIVGKGAVGPASLISPESWRMVVFIPRMYESQARGWVEAHGGEWDANRTAWTSEGFAVDEARGVLTLYGADLCPVLVADDLALCEVGTWPTSVYLDTEDGYRDGWLIAGRRSPGIELNDYAVALGNAAEATEYGATAVGHGATATGHHATALGRGAKAGQPGSVAVGGVIADNVLGTEYGSVAIGAESRVWPAATKGVALGFRAYIDGTANNAVALGAHSVAGKPDAVALGTKAVADAQGAVQIGEGTNTEAWTIQYGSRRLAFDDDLAALRARVTALEKDLGPLRARVTALETAVKQLQK